MTVTCLGCGLGCDDLTVTSNDQRLVVTGSTCALGQRWLDAGVKAGSGNAAQLGPQLERAASLLARARAPLVYLAPDLTVEAYRHAIALADLLGARLDGVASDTAAPGILAGQTRGRATATLGELRHRADLFLFWGVDPIERYPCFTARLIAAKGLSVPEGRSGRTIVAVDIGESRGPKDADLRIAVAPAEETGTLGLLKAAVQQRPIILPAGLAPLRDRLGRARYIALVHDAEPSSLPTSATRVEGLIALAQALNGPARAALLSLRAGGNRTGAEAVMTWQTGFPMSVEFGRGAPDYRPEPASVGIAAGRHDVVLVVGRAAGVPAAVLQALKHSSVIAIGPGADDGSLPGAVVIATGSAGIHESGTAYRMDDVPLPVRSLLPNQVEARATLERLVSMIAGARPR